MSDDVTIAREDAEMLADFLRRHGLGEHHRLVRLLDLPPVSLRDEVADIVRVKNSGHFDGFYTEQADAILAVVRKRVEALPSIRIHDARYLLLRDTVLRLLGGTT